MGRRLLSLEWATIHLGSGRMGDASAKKLHNLDPRSLESDATRLHLGAGPLALKEIQLAKNLLNSSEFSKPYRVTKGKNFRLKNFDPADTQGHSLKKDATKLLQDGAERLSELQERLYAQDKWAVLLIFQAMDAAGKDGAVRHVMSGVNPQGCQVFSFKTPSSEELDHDFLWRTTKALPERGRIGIFNRSYYEEVLITRVHPEILANQNLPASLVTKNLWKERYEDINAFEKHMARNGSVIRKFFLNLSKGEQKKRFLSRLDEPEKNWKFSEGDVRERECWPKYMEAYEEAIRNTASEHAPWYVVPADSKWFTRLVISSVVIETLESLKLEYPKVDDAKKSDLAAARTRLLQEK
jgi:PPK2 family polyphosphate:nucleotide phosphotransferase